MYDSIMSNHFAIPRRSAGSLHPPPAPVKLAYRRRSWRNLENKTSRAGEGATAFPRSHLRNIISFEDRRRRRLVTSVIRATDFVTIDTNDANTLYSITALAADKGAPRSCRSYGLSLVAEGRVSSQYFPFLRLAFDSAALHAFSAPLQRVTLAITLLWTIRRRLFA